MSYSILRVKRLKNYADVTGLQKHVQRQTENYTNQDINKELIHTNYDLINSTNIDFNGKVKERIEEGFNGKRKIRTDAIKLVDGLITSDSVFFDKMNRLETEDFFEHALEFVKKEFGEKNIMYATVHLDEKTPHMHFGFVPLTDDGRLSAKDFLGNKTALSFLQDRFNDFVKEKGYEMKRGESYRTSNRKHIETSKLKNETEYHKKQLDKAKSDLKHEFERINNLNSITPTFDEKKLKKNKKELSEINKVDVKWFNRVDPVELEDFYGKVENVLQITDELYASLDDNEIQIQELTSLNKKMNHTLKEQTAKEEDLVKNAVKVVEDEKSVIKAKYEDLTHVVERKAYEIAEERSGKLINKLTEDIEKLETDLLHAKDEKEVLISKAVMTEKDKYSVLEAEHKDLTNNFKSAAAKLADEKTVEIKHKYNDLEMANKTLSTDLSHVKAENEGLITENKMLDSTIFDKEERYQEMKTGFEEQKEEIKGLERRIEHYKQTILTFYNTAREYINEGFDEFKEWFREDIDEQGLENELDVIEMENKDEIQKENNKKNDLEI